MVRSHEAARGSIIVMEALFWISVCGVLYPYFGYPVALWVARSFSGRTATAVTHHVNFVPSVTMVIPVCNEEVRIERKIANTAALRYPADRLQIIFVSDGSTDRTVQLFRLHARETMTLVELPFRQGKAAALNAGLQQAKHSIVVFSDASIELVPDALRHIVRKFQDPQIGCVSGEDQIAESGGEGWYGRYEMLVRRLESGVHSIVGASGSFYAQRRILCAPFEQGMAPDFLSVLRTVQCGFRAISEPEAVGAMTSVKDSKREFERKVRTVVRGMTTLFSNVSVLNPLRFGVFAFEMFSHKLLRWLVPFWLVAMWLSSLALADYPSFLTMFILQSAVYAFALLAYWKVGLIRNSLFGKVALYFSVVNAAILVAWIRFVKGERQELWTPTQR